jgi:hypothetical protein
MSVNNHRPHVFVLPEDDANRQLANGFHLEVGGTRQMQVLPEVRGWPHVLDVFESVHVAGLRRFPERFIVLLIDFDEDTNRLARFQRRIPEDVAGRVFVLGTWSAPERLTARLGNQSCETVGRVLADECRTGRRDTWTHMLLRHNAAELVRLEERVCAILFPPAN